MLFFSLFLLSLFFILFSNHFRCPLNFRFWFGFWSHKEWINSGLTVYLILLGNSDGNCWSNILSLFYFQLIFCVDTQQLRSLFSLNLMKTLERRTKQKKKMEEKIKRQFSSYNILLLIYPSMGFCIQIPQSHMCDKRQMRIYYHQ